jgi:putative endonuclease
MASKTGTLYTGMTSTVFGRSTQHKEKLIKGFASKYNCDRLVYYEGFYDVRKAISREKELKGWTRKKKIALIESVNPRWEDLSKTWGWKMLMANEAIKDQKEKSKQPVSPEQDGDPSLRSG